MFRKLRFKLTVTYIFLILISMLILGIYLFHSIEEYFYTSLKIRLISQAQLAGKLIEDTPHDWSPESINHLSQTISGEGNVRVTIISRDGRVLGDSEKDFRLMENHLNRPEFMEAQKKGIGTSVRRSSTLNTDMMYAAVPLKRDGRTAGFLRLAYPLSEAKHAFLKMWAPMLLAILTVFILSVPISLLLGKKITKPIEKLNEFAKEITKGNYKTRAEVYGSDEIGELANTLNHMAETIKEKINLLSEERTKLKTILANMNSGIIMINKNGRIELLNPAAEKLLTHSKDSCTGMHYTSAVKSSKLISLISEAFKKNEIIEEKETINNKKTFEITVIPLKNQRKKTAGLIVVLHDITKISKLEKIRRDFVANASHELRTPVTSIKGFAETLLDGAMYDHKACREFIEIINREADRLIRLINELLELSKIEAKEVKLSFKPMDIRMLVSESVKRMEKQFTEAELTVEVKLPKNEVIVNIDKELIEQVLFNLMDNAIKYTPKGGRIEIEAADKEHDVIVWVRDTGIGIPPKDIDRIFERFYRVDKARSRKAGGTGLGLSIVKHIIDVHGGMVGVNSTLGKGSEFFFTLPKDKNNSIL